MFTWSREGGLRGNPAFEILCESESPDSLAEALRNSLSPTPAQRSRIGCLERYTLQFSDRRVELHGYWTTGNLFAGVATDVSDISSAKHDAESECRDLKTKSFLLRKRIAELEDHLESMARGFVNAVEAKDPYTAGHSDRVMEYAVRIGQAIGLSGRQLKVLALGAMVHDVGKIGIPDAVLMKPGRLTPEEFEIIQTHTDIGARVMRGIPYFEDCMPIIEMHHERLDGQGYPAGASGEEIPLLVRITTVADVFDALTSTRAYSRALTVEAALQILENDAATGILDGKIVAVLADIVKREGVLWNDELDQAA